ncbi:MarR family transcriptional regulator [Citromicrobium bathyomarinum]|uniref:MarR family transcriptional regulator n=1 Tax=Citromicrobium bathyomarinum TaxID=72174 RepID=UPI003159F481
MLHTESRAAGNKTDLSYAPVADAPSGGQAYAPSDAAGLPVAISLFADRGYLRSEMQADAQLAGFRVVQSEPVAASEGGTARPLGDIVLVDAPAADAPTLALIERLAERAVRSGARLIVSTTIGALEPVMVSSKAADPVLLVEPGRAERLVAFGETLSGLFERRVRDLSGEDRVAVMRLVERVTVLAQKLDGLVGEEDGAAGAFAFATGVASPGRSFIHEEGGTMRGKPARLPTPQRVRATIRKRQLRARFLDAELFADPAWDILLDLTAARAEGRRVSVTSLCIASGVPPTTALRWIGQMTRQGLLVREEDRVDRRRAFVALSETALDAMARYFEAVGDCDCAGI